MNNEQKPQEFYIHYMHQEFHTKEEFNSINISEKDKYFHVIEYSAYEKLRKRINELEETIYHKDNKIRELELGKSILKNERDHFLDLYKRKVLEGVLT
jgi:hypothetical protein